MIDKSDLQDFVNRIEKSVRRLEDRCSNFGLTDRWLDNQEVMELLKISPRTLQSYRDQGILPYSRLGDGSSKFYYKASQVEELLERNMSDHP